MYFVLGARISDVGFGRIWRAGCFVFRVRGGVAMILGRVLVVGRVGLFWREILGK